MLTHCVIADEVILHKMCATDDIETTLGPPEDQICQVSF